MDAQTKGPPPLIGKVDYKNSIEKGITYTIAFFGINLVIRSLRKDMGNPVSVKTLVSTAIAGIGSVLIIDYSIRKGWVDTKFKL